MQSNKSNYGRRGDDTLAYWGRRPNLLPNSTMSLLEAPIARFKDTLFSNCCRHAAHVERVGRLWR